MDFNPESFIYGEECDPAYLTGEFRCFADEAATQSVLEDRSRLFYAAMQTDAAELFAASAMQKKLLCMCEGIREAYGLEKIAEPFPWEQYLDTPLYQTVE